MEPKNKFYTTDYGISTPYYKGDIPKRIMVASDIHYQPSVNRDTFRLLVKYAQESKPDYIVMPGDQVETIDFIDDINIAENLKGKIMEINESDRPELPEGVYYIDDLIGFDVYTDEGKLLGKLDDIFNTGANDIYQVGDILLPAIDEVLKQIDTENKKIIVHIIKGLI